MNISHDVTEDKPSVSVHDGHPPFLTDATETQHSAHPSGPDLDAVWAMVSRKPDQAKTGFENHLLHAPNDPEGHYGLGYLYLKQGKRDLSAQHLCLARGASDVETARDVRQLIKRNRLRCSES